MAPCGLRGCKNGPAPFPGWMSYKATKPGLVFFGQDSLGKPVSECFFFGILFWPEVTEVLVTAGTLGHAEFIPVKSSLPAYRPTFSLTSHMPVLHWSSSVAAANLVKFISPAWFPCHVVDCVSNSPAWFGGVVDPNLSHRGCSYS